ncbi:MAG: methyl-accepting chemotaxis protein, partial [Candidatus Sulfotelmatobacter sp.]
MRLTIKRKLFGLTIGSLAFVAGVSATGYWDITSVEKTTADVAATGSSIRNHIEAGVYNDLTRSDISAVFTQKGDDQQNKAEEFAQHCKLLQDRIAKAREFAVDPVSRAMLDEETQIGDQYVKAGSSLADAIVHNPSAATSQLGPYLQLYKDLQGKIEATSDQLAKSAKDAEVGAAAKAARATRAMFLMCGLSLMLLLLVAVRVTVSITRGLDSFSTRFKAMAEANDLTARVDQDRKDEIGELGRCLNSFVEKVHDILTQIAQSAQSVAGSSETLSSTSQRSRPIRKRLLPKRMWFPTPPPRLARISRPSPLAPKRWAPALKRSPRTPARPPRSPPPPSTSLKPPQPRSPSLVS